MSLRIRVYSSASTPSGSCGLSGGLSTWATYRKILKIESPSPPVASCRLASLRAAAASSGSKPFLSRPAGPPPSSLGLRSDVAILASGDKEAPDRVVLARLGLLDPRDVVGIDHVGSIAQFCQAASAVAREPDC